MASGVWWLVRAALAAVALAAGQVPGHDGRGDAAREGRLRQVLAQGPVHAHAVLWVQLHVGDVARQRMAEVGELAFSVAQTARAEAHDRLVVILARQLDHVGERERSARDGQPVDHRVLLRGKLAEAISKELLERRWQRAEVRVGAIGSDEDGHALASLTLRLVDLQGAALEQRVDHLEQEERVAADAGEQVAANLPRPVAHSEARLHEAHLLLGRQAAQLGPHDALEHVQHAVFRSRDHQHEDG